MEKSLEEYRQMIDQIDAGIQSLFALRMKVADEIGAVKRRSGAPVFVPEREEALLNRLSERAGDRRSAEEIRALYAVILELSRKRQEGGPVSE